MYIDRVASICAIREYIRGPGRRVRTRHIIMHTTLNKNELLWQAPISVRMKRKKTKKQMAKK